MAHTNIKIKLFYTFQLIRIRGKTNLDKYMVRWPKKSRKNKVLVEHKTIETMDIKIYNI
jgi:hypothetical protein